jgi:hypothetical protein
MEVNSACCSPEQFHNGGVDARLSPGAADPPYFITRTRLASPAHDGVIEPLLKQLDVDATEWRTEGLVVLRAVVMDPFFGDASATPDHLAGFVAALRVAAADARAIMTSGTTSATRQLIPTTTSASPGNTPRPGLRRSGG